MKQSFLEKVTGFFKGDRRPKTQRPRIEGVHHHPKKKQVVIVRRHKKGTKKGQAKGAFGKCRNRP